LPVPADTANHEELEPSSGGTVGSGECGCAHHGHHELHGETDASDSEELDSDESSEGLEGIDLEVGGVLNLLLCRHVFIMASCAGEHITICRQWL